MRARVKVAFFDNNGIHRKGDIVDVKTLSDLVEPIGTGETEKPTKKEAKTDEKATEKIVTKKVTKRKK